MPAFKSIECSACHKKGPFMAGCNVDETEWHLLCLWCYHIMSSTKLTAEGQMRLQQEVGGKGCPNCGMQCLMEATIDLDKTASRPLVFQCTNCGFTETMTPLHFERYMDLVGRRLNP